MSADKLTGDALCKAMMLDTCKCIHLAARAHVDALRYGPETLVRRHASRHILALASAQLTANQLDALEAALRQVQEETVGALLSLVDGSRQPAGFPEKIRLIDMDTGEEICPGGLQWAFSAALVEWRARPVNEETTNRDGA